MCLFFVICKKITTADFFLHPAFCIPKTGKVPSGVRPREPLQHITMHIYSILARCRASILGVVLHNTNGKCRITNLMKPVKNKLYSFILSVCSAVSRIFCIFHQNFKFHQMYALVFYIPSFPKSTRENKTKNTNLFRTGRTFPEGFLRLPEGGFPSRYSASKR